MNKGPNLVNWVHFLLEKGVVAEIVDKKIVVSVEDKDGKTISLSIEQMSSGALRGHCSGLHSGGVGYGASVLSSVEDFLAYKTALAA